MCLFWAGRNIYSDSQWKTVEKTLVSYVNPKFLSIRPPCAPKVLMIILPREAHRYSCDWKSAIKLHFRIDWNNCWAAKKCPCQSCLYFCPKAYSLDLFQNFPGAQESGSCQHPLWTSESKGVNLQHYNSMMAPKLTPGVGSIWVLSRLCQVPLPLPLPCLAYMLIKREPQTLWAPDRHMHYKYPGPGCGHRLTPPTPEEVGLWRTLGYMRTEWSARVR